jgi:transcriptional regulator with PAS, ATPase and Fis domain
MAREATWVTGFLTSILIEYLDERCPQAAQQLPYGTLFAGSDFADHPGDPLVLLKDPNQWLPQDVLTRLVTLAEDMTGEADVAYRATVAHFSRPDRRGPSIFEIIATLLNDVRHVVSSSSRWGGAFTNNMTLQAIVHAERPEATLLTHIATRARITRTPGLFFRGQCEGFPRLYDGVATTGCREEFTQLTLRQLVHDFDAYEVVESNGHIRVIDRRSGAVTAEAEPVALRVEHLPNTEPHPAEVSIVPLQGASFPVYAADGATPADQATANAARITQGGWLRRGRVGVQLEPGAIFGAPYSRYRFEWTDRRTHVIPAEDRLREASRLLFRHLQELKRTQHSLLRSERTNATLLTENVQLRRELAAQHRFADLAAASPAMRELCRQMELVADTDSTVLLSGETGTGKEIVARALHYNGPRKDGRFLAVNCGALHENLLESELFGHERGAFTGAVQRRAGKFEAADGGTLFLDEIGELSPTLQVKLLRVLQERVVQRVGGDEDIPVNVRIIAATHRNLKEMITAGRFRQDLYYRLHVIPLVIPPLRERKPDIPLLAHTLLDRLRRRLGKPAERFAPDALRILLEYAWPGNVRELENVIERALILAGQDSVLTPSHLPPEWFAGASTSAAGEPWTVFTGMDWSAFSRFFDEGGSFDDLLGRIEWEITKRAVEAHEGNKSHAARTLKRSYRWLRKLEKEHLGPTDA